MINHDRVGVEDVKYKWKVRDENNLEEHTNDALDSEYAPSEVEDDSTESDDTSVIAEPLAQMRIEEFFGSI
jgi:hypothetical protein